MKGPISRISDRTVVQKLDARTGAIRSHILGRSRKARLWFAALVLGATLTCSANAQYSIDRCTVAGGGAASTGSAYTVSGTIGQTEAGVMSGGAYSLVGGFWGVLGVVQTPEAPLLSIIRTLTNTVAVTWPGPATAWVLQQNTNSVSSVNWSNVLSGIEDRNGKRLLILYPSGGNRYYRLFKP